MLEIEQTMRRLEAESHAAAEALRASLAEELQFLRHLIAAIRVNLNNHRERMRAESGATALPPFFLSKLVRTGRAVGILCGEGYGVEAEVLVRAGLEALINLLFVTERNSEERARLYIEFDRVLSKQYFDRIDRWPDMREDPFFNQRREEVLVEYERVKANYPDQSFWAGKLVNGRLRGMANEVGLGWYYDVIYWFGSNHVHSNARSANEYVELAPDGKVTYKFGPSARYATVPLNLVADFLIRALDRTLSFYGIETHETIHSLRQRHEAVFGKLPSAGDNATFGRPGNDA